MHNALVLPFLLTVIHGDPEYCLGRALGVAVAHIYTLVNAPMDTPATKYALQLGIFVFRSILLSDYIQFTKNKKVNI